MNILKALTLIIAGGSALLGLELSEHVHSTRWAVKTLGDSLAIPAIAQQTTIEEQLAMRAEDVGEDIGRLPSERQLYVLQANLVSAKKEFDGDYHLVLEDPATHLHMIAEIPDTTGHAPIQDREKFLAARETIDQVIGKPGLRGIDLKRPLPVEVTGIGFFDEPHMFTPKGMPKNCREIHPVVGIRLLQNPASERS